MGEVLRLFAICIVPICIAGCPNPDEVIGDTGGVTSGQGVGERSYEYDAAGRLIKVTYDGGGSIAATYDKSGNAITVTGTSGTGGGAPPGCGGEGPLLGMFAFTLLSICCMRLHPARRRRREIVRKAATPRLPGTNHPR